MQFASICIVNRKRTCSFGGSFYLFFIMEIIGYQQIHKKYGSIDEHKHMICIDLCLICVYFIYL